MSKDKKNRRLMNVGDEGHADAETLRDRWGLSSRAEATRRALHREAHQSETYRGLEKQRDALAADNKRLEADLGRAQAAEQKLNRRLEELEAEANQSSAQAECLSNDIDAAVSQLEHAGLLDPDDELARPLTDDCTRIERTIRRYKAALARVEELEAQSVAARAVVDQFEQAKPLLVKALPGSQDSDGGLVELAKRLIDERDYWSDSAENWRSKTVELDTTKKERDHALVVRDRVRRERDEALSKLDCRNRLDGWVVFGALVVGAAAMFAATWIWG